MKTLFLLVNVLVIPTVMMAQAVITIDGQFDDWQQVTAVVIDSANDEHDTDWYGDGLSEPVPRHYSDVDILEVKFTHDRENLYGYVKARGIVGQTSTIAAGQKAGRYYFIITIDVDNNDSTGYPLEQGNYWPNSTGYDMNMEVEFYDGAFNTGHYIHHDFLTPAALTNGRADLANHIIRLGPGTYDNYLQWVTFPDTTFVYVEDKGPVVEGGIIEVAVSDDGHEAEMKAPMWGFFWDENGQPIIQLGDTIDVSFSLEGSGELSESAAEAGYNGTKSIWGSDTADPIEKYVLTDVWSTVQKMQALIADEFRLDQPYPNPFNPQTTISYTIPMAGHVRLSVLNINGRLVQELVDTWQSAGYHRIVWDGRNQQGDVLASGVYFALLKVGVYQSIRRMVFMK